MEWHLALAGTALPWYASNYSSKTLPSYAYEL